MRSSTNTSTHLHIRVRTNVVSRAVSERLSMEEALGACSGDRSGDKFDLLRLHQGSVLLSRNKTLVNEWDRIAFGSHL